MNNVPRIGVGVFVRNTSGEILLQKRTGAHGANTWSLPGGHLEFNESIENCAKREAMEEFNVEIKNVKVLGITEDIMLEENKHYVTIFVDSELASGSEPKIMEPDKTLEMTWVSNEELKSGKYLPMFMPLKNFLEGKKYPK
ncbi:MAG: NUDIX hydrolase [Candidatus Micrarchaeota archaeon]|nr:NUDIX hydrolase [Candidatus Micrarchaeota archaeon]